MPPNGWEKKKLKMCKSSGWNQISAGSVCGVLIFSIEKVQHGLLGLRAVFLRAVDRGDQGSQ